jgi:hypothetical protein
MVDKKSGDVAVWHPLADKAYWEDVGNAKKGNDVPMTEASPGNDLVPEGLDKHELSM